MDMPDSFRHYLSSLDYRDACQFLMWWENADSHRQSEEIQYEIQSNHPKLARFDGMDDYFDEMDVAREAMIDEDERNAG